MFNKFSERAIRCMSVERRRSYYEMEKQELFDKSVTMTPHQVEEAHKKLAEKWKI